MRRTWPRAAGYIDRAVAAELPDLVVVPEFFNHPYVFQYRDYRHIDEAESADGIAISTMRAKAREHGIHIIATIFEAESAGICYDSAIVIDPAGENPRALPQGTPGGGAQPGEDLLPLRLALPRVQDRRMAGWHKHLLRHVLSRIRALRRGQRRGVDRGSLRRAGGRLLARDHAHPRLRERRLLRALQQGGGWKGSGPSAGAA